VGQLGDLPLKQMSFVIVGGGLAGAKAAETLRAEGFDGEVVLFADEPELPYERPPLSKEFLLGKAGREKAYVHPLNWYAEHNVDLRTGVQVAMIDPAAHLVTFDGGTITYDKLLLATGASPRRIDLPGAGLENVRYLRTLPESEALRAAFTPESRVVVVGAGWIGLETAAAARIAGAAVTVLELQTGALHVALGPELGAKFADLHRAHGVEFRFGESAAEFRAAGQGQSQRPGTDTARVGTVVTTEGAELSADLVIVGIGATPNDALAKSAGLETDDGVVTDSALRTSDPDVFAVGDVANSYLPLLGRHVRVEHWSNALHGGKAAARSMLGQQVEYNRVPYFYSDQYDLGMEVAGLPLPGTYDHVVYRGDSAALEFIAFWLDKENHLVAGMNVNIWDVNDDIQSLIRAVKPLDPARLANPDIPLTEV
jgi:NADPH-dependent 2,4-dienoyl-CoA reductase/sulfur reductase-like enzyme